MRSNKIRAIGKSLTFLSVVNIEATPSCLLNALAPKYTIKDKQAYIPFKTVSVGLTGDIKAMPSVKEAD